MEPYNENLSASESLEIITRMIRKTQGNVKKSGFYFLFWGWVIAIANVGMFLLIQIEYSRPYLIWLITLPAFLVSFLYGLKHRKESRVVTHIDKTTMWLWITFGLSIFTLVPFGSAINWNLNPVILIMTVIPTLVSGILIRFKPLILGGVCIWLCGVICFLVEFPYQYLVGAIAIICGYLIPGYMLKFKRD